MSTGRKFSLLLAAILFLHLLYPLVRTQAGENDIPTDLKIQAQYGAGFSQWKPWKVTIASDGKVVQEIYGPGLNATKKELTLTKRDLNELLAKAKEADFFALPQKYDQSFMDGPTLILSITANKKTHSVLVNAPDFQKDQKAMKRFNQVWSEVLRKVPSPNPDQNPE